MTGNSKAKRLNQAKLIIIASTGLITATAGLIISFQEVYKPLASKKDSPEINTSLEKTDSSKVPNSKELLSNQKTLTAQVNQVAEGTGHILINGNRNGIVNGNGIGNVNGNVNGSFNTTNQHPTNNYNPNAVIKKQENIQNQNNNKTENRTECVGGGQQTNCGSGATFNNYNK